MYQVEVKRLNEQIKRNIDRFPETFRFQLNNQEKDELVANCDRFESLKHSSVNPYAFTEQGVAMLSAVLRSDVAVKVSIQIMNDFVELRRLVGQETIQHLRLSSIENKLIEHDQKFNKLFFAICPILSVISKMRPI
ncbi:ORF6N domain-containing protein [Sphingobacterium sp. SGG-5]|uniref:ORF6N domain-containing protein n=1 Tax=Sphingobacterium sp. SGG-5 TaxID=2710881 RepID=UPI0019D0C016|nr:ORF6N domain-containing protein [Sphingobacterium sp. SGG-5]